ncbi:Predicted DNA-binding transcriptional regulator YafY, contains an HTH and WYL domains [Marinomonas fungiae]|uniref:Predicted DNA-binding transcriptional regulator YafY, contains an HTH and WYL domains n=2 Tax=Marinomonas fungiae TaxID=1137284 RepID=A0A0K6IV54_9GAMM|nr:Predicted DNA-binding transcriptional regulator YafY, contains an HTH and WYL domains [Marinomonas fungiae]
MGVEMDSVIRYISILELLPIAPKPSLSTKDILEKLEHKGFSVNPRSLQRDLVALAKYYPIICNDKVRPHRWRFSEDYKGSFAAMDVSSAVSTILVNEYLLSIMPASLLSQLSPQLNRAKSFLQSHSDSTYFNWLEKVKIVPDGKVLMPAQIESGVWATVCEAIMSNKALDVEYYSRSRDKVHLGVFHPYGLIIRKSATYVLGSYNDYENVWQYALHRFRSVKLSSSDFRPNPSFSLQCYIDDGEPGFKYSDESLHLVALIDKGLAKRLEETKLSDTQTILETDSEEWLLLRAVIPDDRDMRSWLLSQGASLIVREPVSLRDELLEEVASIQALSISLNGLGLKIK